MYYIYVIRDRDNSDRYYLGYTSNLENRLTSHNNGENRSTRGIKWELVYYEAYKNEYYARERERVLKRNRRMKQFLLSRIRESLK